MNAVFQPLFDTFRAKPASASSEVGSAGIETKPVSAVPGGSAAHAHSHGEVQVQVERSEGRITQVRIQCSCGQLIELDCEY